MPRVLIAATFAALALAGCGGDSDQKKVGSQSSELRRQLDETTAVSAADFPSPNGRTLQQMADTVNPGPQVGLATSIFRPGQNRLAFGLIDEKRRFLYGKTAVYVASSAKAKAEGPYPAPADLLVTDGPFRSQTAASEKDPFAAVYEASVPLKRPGKAEVLVMTKLKGGVAGAATVVKVLAPEDDPVVPVGARAPKVKTETVTSARGDIASIDTRLPPDDMHKKSFSEVVGKKPVALVFATPQLCESRVCGPVVDIAAQMKAKYGDRMEFIHQEVYVDNNLKKGLRPPLRRFGLPTEPWLFTVGRDGRVAGRLEGSFGLRAFERAVKAAL